VGLRRRTQDVSDVVGDLPPPFNTLPPFFTNGKKHSKQTDNQIHFSRAGKNNLLLEAWETFAKEIGEGTPKPVIKTIKEMATRIPQAANKVAAEMIDKYGDNEIYHVIVDKITDRAEITLRQINH
jgi:hypothetical protein